MIALAGFFLGAGLAIGLFDIAATIRHISYEWLLETRQRRQTIAGTGKL